MSPKDFNLLLGKFIDDEVNILASKGQDYTDNGEGNVDEDRLFNFKEVGKRFGISPLLVWGIYWTKHNNAIEKFIRTGTVASEPIEERIKDARNYLALGAALIEDLREENLTEENFKFDVEEIKRLNTETTQQPAEEKPSTLSKIFGRNVSASS